MKSIIMIVGILMCASLVHASKSTANSGGWGTAANWNPAAVPLPGDDLIINHTITYTGSLDGSAYNSITIKSGGKLITTIDFSLNSGHAVVIEAGGTLQIGGALTSLGNGSIANSGTLTVTGSLSIASGNTFTNSAGATMTIGGSILSDGGGSFTNNGALSVTGNITLHNGNVYTNNAGATMTVGGNMLSPGNGQMINHGTLNITGYAELKSGSTFSNNSLAQVNGDFNLYGGYTFANDNGNLTIGGTLWSEDWKADITNYGGTMTLLEPKHLGTDVDILGGALPIELVNFKLKDTNNGIMLSWTCLSEFENRCFIIEQSTDGNSFDSIGVVFGAGTSNIMHQYSYLDEKTLANRSRTVYYRLKSLTFDNSFTYSEVKTVQLSNNSISSFTLIADDNYLHVISVRDGFLILYNMQGTICFNSKINSKSELLIPNINLPLCSVVCVQSDVVECKPLMLRSK